MSSAQFLRRAICTMCGRHVSDAHHSTPEIFHEYTGDCCRDHPIDAWPHRTRWVNVQVSLSQDGPQVVCQCEICAAQRYVEQAERYMLTARTDRYRAAWGEELRRRLAGVHMIGQPYFTRAEREAEEEAGGNP